MNDPVGPLPISVSLNLKELSVPVISDKNTDVAKSLALPLAAMLGTELSLIIDNFLSLCFISAWKL